MTLADLTPFEMTLLAVLGLFLVLRNLWHLVRCQLEASGLRLSQAEPARHAPALHAAAGPSTMAAFQRIAASHSMAARRRRVKPAHPGHQVHRSWSRA